MDISFLSPYFLLLLLGIPALWFFPRKPESVTQAVLRSLLFASLVLALSRPVLLAADQALFEVLVLDRSNSVDAQRAEQAAQLAGQWLQQVKNTEKAAIVLIDGGAQDGKHASVASTLSSVGTVVHVGSDTASASPLSAALAAALRQIPENSPGAVTLVSDGLSTDRRWGPAVQAFIQRGIAVNTVDLGRNDTDIYPTAIKAEPVIRVGQTARIHVPVVGRATGLQVRLLDEKNTQLAISEPFDGTGRVDVTVDFEPQNEGFMKLRAEVIAAGGAAPSGDIDTANNQVEKMLAIQSPIRLLYLGERMQNGAARLGGLLGRGFAVQDGSNLQLSAATDLKDYDLVMVDDRSATLMPEVFQQELSAAVRDRGLGLVFSGGKSSFGAGGYDQMALAKALPVEFSQHTEKRDPSTALALVIDTSGSMSGSRMETAKQVARLAVRRLKAHDRIGIVEFYGNRSWALPMQSAANKLSIDRAISRLQAMGGTVLYPGIEEAYYGLKNVKTRYKHILIITDAAVEDANFKALVRRVVKDRINISAVIVGAMAYDKTMFTMTNQGKGRFYSASNRFALPEIILKQPSTMKLPAYKSGNFPLTSRGGEGWWDRINRDAMPALTGYVETKPRPGSEVLIEVQGNAHPVLSSWHYGLGRVTALMTEPVGEGTQGWQNWRDYGRLLGRVASRTADDGQAFRYTVQRSDHSVTVVARRYSQAGNLVPEAVTVDAQGQQQAALQFKQLSPEHFSAELTVPADQDLRVEAAVKNLADTGRQTRVRLISTAHEDVSAETQVDTATAMDLAALAEATSGVAMNLNEPQNREFKPEGLADQSSLALFKLAPYALLLALLLYLAELVHRRWPRT